MYKVVVDIKKIGEFPTFGEAFSVMRRKIKEFLLPPFTNEFCWIKYLKSDITISFIEARRIARKIGFIGSERRKTVRT